MVRVNDFCIYISQIRAKILQTDYSNSILFSKTQNVVSLLIKEFCNSCQDFLTNQGQTGLVILRFPCLVSIQISDKVHCKEQTIKYISHNAFLKFELGSDSPPYNWEPTFKK